MGCTGTTIYNELLKQKSKVFYSDLSKINTAKTINNYNNKSNIEDLSEKIKLNISLNQIKANTSYKIKISKIGDNLLHPLEEYSYFEIKDDETAYLKIPLIIKYYFEKEQPLWIELVKENSNNSQKYEIKTSLGCIMGSKKNTLQKDISSTEREKLILKAEKIKEAEDIIKLKFNIKSNKNVLFNEIKNKIYYEIYSDNILYRSECLNNAGIFNPHRIPKYLLNKNRIQIKFYNCYRKVVGDYKLNIDEFTNGKTTFNIRVNGNQFNILSKCKLTKDFTFVDYLKAGMQIGLSVAIDFTQSNGYQNDKNSFHYIHGLEPNLYERAIFACGNIVAYYDFDQLFPCFGFGAKINNQKYKFFNLNFKDDPNIQYIQGIIDEYHNAINVVELYGPTNFGPIINNINNMIKKEYNTFKYHILMILTDGIIDDMDDTIDELVEGSFLPLSVIIIGIGKADFSNMVELDADENPLINSKGVKAARDLVQFVPFLKYESNPEILANKVLEEIPRQIMEYYEQNNLDPIKLVT